ncbi:DUF3857 domain-containing protein, partial [bacterium]|nr:DUF3857 domain-containing protein [bacterium]
MFFMRSLHSKKFVLSFATIVCAGFVYLQPAIAEDGSDSIDKRFANAPGLEEYPLASALYLQDDLTYSVAPDGSTRFFEHDVIKMLNNEGVSAYSTIMRPVDTRYEEVTVVSAQTITPEGKVIKVPKESITTVATIDEAPYESRKIVSIEFPHCVTSGIIEYEIATTRKSGACKYWWQGSFMQNLDPILDSTFTLNVPRGRKFSSYVSPSGIDGPQKSQTEEVDTYVWRSSDSTPLVSEPSMPPIINYLKSVEVSNCSSWEEFATWYGAEWDRALANTDKFGLKLTSISSNSKPKRQRIQDILDWFSARYHIDPSVNATYKFYTPDQLFECKSLGTNDVSMLLCAILKRYGVDAYPVLATRFTSDGHLAERTPALEKVEHIMLRIVGDDGQDWWINPGEGAVLLECTPPSYQNKDAVYLASGDQQAGIVRLPSSQANRYIRDIRLDIMVEERNADIALNLTLQGETAKTWRSAMIKTSDLPSNEKETLLTYLSQEINKEFAVPTVPYSYYFPENTEPDSPFSLNSTVISAGLTSSTPDRKFSMPLSIFGGDRLISLLTTQKKRTKPIDLEHPFIDEIRVHAELPKEAKITSWPKDVQTSTPCGSFCAFTRCQDREVWHYSRLEVDKSWFEVKDINELMPLVQAQSDCFKTMLKYTMPPKADGEDEEEGK